MCMLLSSTAAPDELAQADKLGELIRDLQMQLRIHDDQHAAVASELDSLASTEPCQFHVNQLWTLIRAIGFKATTAEPVSLAHDRLRASFYQHLSYSSTRATFTYSRIAQISLIPATNGLLISADPSHGV